MQRKERESASDSHYQGVRRHEKRDEKDRRRGYDDDRARGVDSDRRDNCDRGMRPRCNEFESFNPERRGNQRQKLDDRGRDFYREEAKGPRRDGYNPDQGDRAKPSFSSRPQPSNNCDRSERGGFRGGRGGGGDRGGRSGNGGGFRNGDCDRGGSQIAKNPYKIQVASNLYKLWLQGDLIVHQYSLEVTPEDFWEADQVQRILRTKWTQIETTIGPFLPAGRTVLLQQQLSESVEFKIVFRGE